MPGGSLEMRFENCNNKLQGNSNLGIPAGSTAKPWKTRELNMETLPSGNGIEQRSWRAENCLYFSGITIILFFSLGTSSASQRKCLQTLWAGWNPRENIGFVFGFMGFSTDWPGRAIFHGGSVCSWQRSEYPSPWSEAAITELKISPKEINQALISLNNHPPDLPINGLSAASTAALPAEDSGISSHCTLPF